MPIRRTNRLLSLLSDDDYERWRPHLSQVILEYKKNLYEASRPIEHVYFPVDGVASLVIAMSDGDSAEVGTIGNEGLVGLPICLGDHDAHSSAYVQVPGMVHCSNAPVNAIRPQDWNSTGCLAIRRWRPREKNIGRSAN